MFTECQDKFEALVVSLLVFTKLFRTSHRIGRENDIQTIVTMDPSPNHGGLMVSALDSGASAPGSSPGRGHCVVFLGKTLYSHCASLHPGV